MLDVYNRIRNYDVPQVEKHLLLALSCYADDNGRHAHPGVARLARDMSLSGYGVELILKRLEKKKIIIADSRSRGGRGKSTDYSIHLENAPLLDDKPPTSYRVSKTPNVVDGKEIKPPTTLVEKPQYPQPQLVKPPTTLAPSLQDPQTESKRVLLDTNTTRAREENPQRKIIPNPPLEMYQEYYKHRLRNGQWQFGPPYSDWQLDPDSTWGYLHYLEQFDLDASNTRKSEWLPEYVEWCKHTGEKIAFYQKLRGELVNGHYPPTEADTTVPLPVH